MTRRGRRSVQSQQRRWLSRFISRYSYRDQDLAESARAAHLAMEYFRG